MKKPHEYENDDQNLRKEMKNAFPGHEKHQMKNGKWLHKWPQNFHPKLILSTLFYLHMSFCRSCIIGPQLDVKICALGTVINRLAYPADYCHLEGAGRQSQPMPIRWMAWESILMVSNSHKLLPINPILIGLS